MRNHGRNPPPVYIEVYRCFLYLSSFSVVLFNCSFQPCFFDHADAMCCRFLVFSRARGEISLSLIVPYLRESKRRGKEKDTLLKVCCSFTFRASGLFDERQWAFFWFPLSVSPQPRAKSREKKKCRANKWKRGLARQAAQFFVVCHCLFACACCYHRLPTESRRDCRSRD